MAARQLPSQEALRQLLDYDPETGILIWKDRGPHWFRDTKTVTAKTQAEKWSRRYAGKVAFTCEIQGYLKGAVLGKTFSAHRVIFKLMTGAEPEQVDHINGDRSDNRWSNLRAATPEINARNMGVRHDSTSGVTGVCWGKKWDKWMAYIRLNDRRVHLGLFETKAEATAARKAAEICAGFVHNNGRSSHPKAVK